MSRLSNRRRQSTAPFRTRAPGLGRPRPYRAETLEGRTLFSFVTAASYPGFLPDDVAAGDFNRDGAADLVAGLPSETVGVMLSDGAGGFRPAVSYDTGHRASSTAVADLNGDGNLDIVTAAEAAQAVDVLIGNGDGTFRPGGSYAVAGSAVRSVAVGDFNGDRKPDLAVADGPANTVSVLRGNGDGSFQSPVSYPTGRY